MKDESTYSSATLTNNILSMFIIQNQRIFILYAFKVSVLHHKALCISGAQERFYRDLYDQLGNEAT